MVRIWAGVEMKTLRLLNVVGARPNFVKIAPLMKAQEAAKIESLLVHTGQHYDEAMSGRLFADLGIREPDANLRVGSGTHGQQTAGVMLGLEPILEHWIPDGVIVVGDVNSSMAGAVTAVKSGFRVAHVEAGLRSGDRTMPEEINRIIVDAVSDLHFCSEASGVKNLKLEGVPDRRVHFVGNVMIDSLMGIRPKAARSAILDELGVPPRQYAVLTVHRVGNLGSPAAVRGIKEAVSAIAATMPVVFPAHPGACAKFGGLDGVTAIAPLGYCQFVRLISEAGVVLTDSGGIQEETTALGVPCLTLRENTERPVTVEVGTNQLVGTNPRTILAAWRGVMSDGIGESSQPPLWDGGASQRVIEILNREWQ